jgi:hypothetical protein
MGKISHESACIASKQLQSSMKSLAVFLGAAGISNRELPSFHKPGTLKFIFVGLK